MTCPTCERPGPDVLCTECAAHTSLRRAFGEGRDRQAGWEPLSVWLLDAGVTPEGDTQ